VPERVRIVTQRPQVDHPTEVTDGFRARSGAVRR
jgi:hypothetical protein